MRCTRKALALAVLSLLFGVADAAAAPSQALRIRLDKASTSPSAPRKIAIDGTAQAGCVPAISRVTLDGADLSVELTAPTTGCAKRSVPFRLAADPAAAAGLASLPAQVYHVRVYLGSGGEMSLAAFSLIDTAAGELAPLPESGFWWTEASDAAPSATGSGMSLEVQDGQLAAGLLGFDGSGASTWYFGSAAMAGSTAKVPLVHLANGDGWFAPLGSRPDVSAGPRLELEFLTPTRARAYLVRNENGRDLEVRSLVLTRSAFATGPAGSTWAGRWVLIPEDGGSARVFDFADPSASDAESFRLVDAAKDANLDCRLIAGTSHPDACTLTASAAPIADFDRVGFDHLAGRDANGMPVQLLRVPR